MKERVTAIIKSVLSDGVGRVRSNKVVVDDELLIPEYAHISEANREPRSIIRVTGEARAKSGVYVWTDGEYQIVEKSPTELDMLVNNPQRLPIAELSDGESIEITALVDEGETLEVYRWGAFSAATGSSPSGLTVELLDGDDTVQESSGTTNDQQTSSPVAQHQNRTDEEQVFKLRAKNDSGSAIDDPGVGCHFGFRVV